MMPILLAPAKTSSSEASFLLCLGPDQGVDPSHLSVIELLPSLFNLVLVALTATVNTSVFWSIFFLADSDRGRI